MNDTDERTKFNRIDSKNILTMFNGQIKAFAHIKDFHVSTSTIGDRLISAIVSIDNRFDAVKVRDKENVIDIKLVIYNICEDEFSLTAPVTEIGFDYSITNRRTKTSYSIEYKSTDNKKLVVTKTPNILHPVSNQSVHAIDNRAFKSNITKIANKLYEDYMEFARSTDTESENILDEI